MKPVKISLQNSNHKVFYTIKIKYWNASGSGFPPFLIPALRNIGILHHKKAKLQKVRCHSVYIYVRKLFKGGNYIRTYGIWINRYLFIRRFWRWAGIWRTFLVLFLLLFLFGSVRFFLWTWRVLEKLDIFKKEFKHINRKYKSYS